MCIVQPVIEQLKAQPHPVYHYVYDLVGLEHHLRRITLSLPSNCQMHYAMKANSERTILDTIGQYVEGFGVASQDEVAKGLTFKSTNHIIFGGPDKTDEGLKYAISEDVQRIHVEGMRGLQRPSATLEDKDRTQHILLRANLAGPFLNTTLRMAGYSARFGIPENEVGDVIEATLAVPDVHLDGFYLRSISSNLDSNLHVGVVELYFKRAKTWSKKHQFPFRHINLDGGIGVNYADLTGQFKQDNLVESFEALIVEQGMEDMTLNFECGHLIVVHIGHCVAEVLDVKRAHGA